MEIDQGHTQTKMLIVGAQPYRPVATISMANMHPFQKPGRVARPLPSDAQRRHPISELKRQPVCSALVACDKLHKCTNCIGCTRGHSGSRGHTCHNHRICPPLPAWPPIYVPACIAGWDGTRRRATNCCGCCATPCFPRGSSDHTCRRSSQVPRLQGLHRSPGGTSAKASRSLSSPSPRRCALPWAWQSAVGGMPRKGTNCIHGSLRPPHPLWSASHKGRTCRSPGRPMASTCGHSGTASGTGKRCRGTNCTRGNS